MNEEGKLTTYMMCQFTIGVPLSNEARAPLQVDFIFFSGFDDGKEAEEKLLSMEVITPSEELAEVLRISTTAYTTVLNRLEDGDDVECLFATTFFSTLANKLGVSSSWSNLRLSGSLSVFLRNSYFISGWLLGCCYVLHVTLLLLTIVKSLTKAPGI